MEAEAYGWIVAHTWLLPAFVVTCHTRIADPELAEADGEDMAEGAGEAHVGYRGEEIGKGARREFDCVRLAKRPTSSEEGFRTGAVSVLIAVCCAAVAWLIVRTLISSSAELGVSLQKLPASCPADS